MMSTVLIADDEPLARRLLREYLAVHPGLRIVAECADGEDALRQIEATQPDLVLLDIQMPRLTGIEVLELSGRRRGVIFTTAHDAHAIKAFELHAVDYLLKPFSQQRFDAALMRAAAIGQALSAEPSALAAAARGGEPLRRLLIREREQVHVIPVDQIEWLQAQGDYLAVHAQGRSRLKLQKISEIEAQLDPAVFVRVHRSALVNVGFLAAIERQGEGHAARMTSGALVPISRSGLERLRAIVGAT